MCIINQVQSCWCLWWNALIRESVYLQNAIIITCWGRRCCLCNLDQMWDSTGEIYFCTQILEVSVSVLSARAGKVIEVGDVLFAYGSHMWRLHWWNISFLCLEWVPSVHSADIHEHREQDLQLNMQSFLWSAETSFTERMGTLTKNQLFLQSYNQKERSASIQLLNEAMLSMTLEKSYPLRPLCSSILDPMPNCQLKWNVVIHKRKCLMYFPMQLNYCSSWLLHTAFLMQEPLKNWIAL